MVFVVLPPIPMWAQLFPPHQQVTLIHQQDVWEFNSILTLSICNSVRFYKLSPVRLCQALVDSPGYHLCFWPTVYRWEVLWTILCTSDTCHKSRLLPIAVQLPSQVQLFTTPWTAAYQALPSMGFSGKNTGVGCHFLLQLFKPSLETFDHYLGSMWNEWNCVVVWTFFSIVPLWDWNENWPFPVLWSLLLLLSRFSRVQLPATPWTAAHQAPPSMGFSSQECWSGVPLPSPS